MEWRYKELCYKDKVKMQRVKIHAMYFKAEVHPVQQNPVKV